MHIQHSIRLNKKIKLKKGQFLMLQAFDKPTDHWCEQYKEATEQPVEE